MTLMQSIYETTHMTPASLGFMFALLPLSVFLYYVIPDRARPLALLLISLRFYAWAEPDAFWVMPVSVALDCAAVRLMCGRFSGSPRSRFACFCFVAAKNLGLLIAYGVYAQIAAVPQILGLQIFTLSSVAAAAALCRRPPTDKPDSVHYGLFCCCFPLLYAGPFSRYEDFRFELSNVRLDIRGVFAGLGQFAEGVFKAGIIGGGLYRLSGEAARFSTDETTALSSFCLVLFTALALYYMLSGFSDMARGLGLVYGLKLPQNFYYPYQSRDIGDFFDRFHITLVRLIRELIDPPTRTDRASRRFLPEARVLLTGVLLGLWFGPRSQYLLWGTFLACFVLLERHLYPDLLRRTPTLFRRVGTFCVILTGFTLFAADSPAGSLALIRSILNFQALYNNRILYLLSSSWLLLLTACFFATSAASLLTSRLRRAWPAAWAAVLGLADCFILVVYTALSL